MRCGWRGYESARLIVGMPVALPLKFQRHFREITKFHVLPADRGKGYGSELLRRLCVEADAADMRLWLTAEPFEFDDGALGGSDLLVLYSRHGFVPAWEEGGPRFMARNVFRGVSRSIILQPEVLHVGGVVH